MPKPILSLLLCCGLFPVLVAGCSKNVSQSDKEVKAYPRGWKTEDVDYAKYATPVSKLRRKVMTEAHNLLKAGDYATIEKRVSQYRSTKEELLDGSSKLQIFYQGLSWVPDTDAAWREKNQRLLQWRKKQPQSLTAKMALANSYFAGGWFAYNSDYDVAKQGLLWKQRRKSMAAILDETYRPEKTDPEWFFLAQESVIGDPAARKGFDKFTGDALKRHGPITQFYLNAVLSRTLEKNGKPGEWQAYAGKVADQLKGEAGDRFYARALWLLIKRSKSDQNPDLKTFDWPRAKRGFELLMNQNPQNPASVAGPYAVAAWFARDRDTLKNLFEKHIGKRIDASVWPTTSQFLAARRWAVGKEED